MVIRVFTLEAVDRIKVEELQEIYLFLPLRLQKATDGMVKDEITFVDSYSCSKYYLDSPSL